MVDVRPGGLSDRQGLGEVGACDRPAPQALGKYPEVHEGLGDGGIVRLEQLPTYPERLAQQAQCLRDTAQPEFGRTEVVDGDGEGRPLVLQRFEQDTRLPVGLGRLGEAATPCMRGPKGEEQACAVRRANRAVVGLQLGSNAEGDGRAGLGFLIQTRPGVDVRQGRQ